MEKLLELLSQIQGKFMFTMYPDDMVSQFATNNGWNIQKFERCVTAANIKRRKQEEWVITNY